MSDMQPDYTLQSWMCMCGVNIPSHTTHTPLKCNWCANTHQSHHFRWHGHAYAILPGWSVGKFRCWMLVGHGGVEKGEMLSCIEPRLCACITPGTTLQMLSKDKSKSLDFNESWDCLLCGWTKSPSFAGGTISLFMDVYDWLQAPTCFHKPCKSIGLPLTEKLQVHHFFIVDMFCNFWEENMREKAGAHSVPHVSGGVCLRVAASTQTLL